MIRSRYKPTRVTKDGRLILSRNDFRKLRRNKYEVNGCICECPTHPGDRCIENEEAILHHPSGRGLGSGKRDDREVVLWCWSCHELWHEKIDGWRTAKIV